MLTDWVGDSNSGQTFAIAPTDRTDSDGDGGKAVTAMFFTGLRPWGCSAHLDMMDGRATDDAAGAGAGDPGRWPPAAADRSGRDVK